MYVYRICNSDEIKKILNNENFNNVGGYGYIYKTRNKESNLNNHVYDDNEKYLHFFKSISSLFYLDTNIGNYICIYDIPLDILKEGYGIGKYWEYINFSHIIEVEEYALNINSLKFDYLVKVSKIDLYIDIEDYLNDDSLKEYLTVIYDNGYNCELSKTESIYIKNIEEDLKKFLKVKNS